jgi:hypothetical protein
MWSPNVECRAELSCAGRERVKANQARGVLDIRDIVPQMRAKALVLHGTGDRVVPFEEGRLLASLLPNARLVPLESVNHVLLEAEPAWTEFLAEVNAFTDTTDAAPSSPEELPELSNRELDVLSLVALGLDNDERARDGRARQAVPPRFVPHLARGGPARPRRGVPLLRLPARGHRRARARLHSRRRCRGRPDHP